MYMLFQYSCAVAALRLLWYMYLFITVMRVLNFGVHSAVMNEYMRITQLF